MTLDSFNQYHLAQNPVAEERSLIAVVGNSLLMDTVEAYLVKNCPIDLVRVQTDVPNTGKYLKSLAPDLIIFDWDTPQAAFVLPFLRERIHIPLVGLDINSNLAVVLSGQLNPIRTADELCLVIQEQIRHKSDDDKVEVLFNTEFFEHYFQKLPVPVS